MAALPPDFNDNTEPDGDETKPTVQVIQFQRPSFTDQAWAFAGGFALFLILSAVLAYVAMLCWNRLTELTLLPEANWTEAFAALILVRVVGMIFNTNHSN